MTLIDSIRGDGIYVTKFYDGRDYRYQIMQADGEFITLTENQMTTCAIAALSLVLNVPTKLTSL